MNELVVEPNYQPYEKEINGLAEMQATVGGYIQAIYPYEDNVAIVCDEEGLFKNYPFNRSVEGGYGGVFGTFFICGLGEDNFISLTPEQVKTYKHKFMAAEILVGVKGNEPLTIKVEAYPKKTEEKKAKVHTAPER